MAYPQSRFGYHQPQTGATISDRRPSYFEEDDSGILDPAILDADIMQSPEDTQLRKGSFANNNGVLSPAESHGWEQQHYGSGLPLEPTSAGVSHPFHDDHNGFPRQNIPHSSVYGHQAHAPEWAFEHGSGHVTPTTNIEFIPPPPPPSFEAPHYTHHRADSARGSFSHPASQPPQHGPSRITAPRADGGFIAAPQVQTPVSPHCHQDYMSMVQQELEGRPVSKRMRPASPPRTTVDKQRLDGIRKKNGRIDIPQERNIQTIDDLIETTNDEDLLKELKQQKRLLRNREAALASRQRKKKHTEDLESREKEFTRSMNGLQSQIDTLELERQSLERNQQIMMHRYQEAQRMIEVMHDEKRDMEMKHTEETSSLRKKIQLLREQLEVGPAPAMSAAPSSTGFTDFNAEMEALNMGPHDWDNFIFVNDLQNDAPEDFNFDSETEPMLHPPALEKKSSSSTVMPSPPKKASDNATDQPIASGLLFFLLLCGAFVASKPANSQPPDLPQVPPDVRAAAPTILNNLLSDTGASSTSANVQTTHHNAQEPAPSGLPHANTRSRTRLDHMHHRLTTPTKQQEIDSAFSLTTAQYASMTNMDYQGYEQSSSRQQQDTPPRSRRNLAETLSKMQQEHTRNSKAEVYTRSLLWDQIPADVVKQFREMVRDHNEIEARQQQQQTSHDDMYAFKVES